MGNVNRVEAKDEEENPYEPDMLVEGKEHLESLSCPICLQVLADPYDCKQCETSYCQECIRRWHSKHDGECPSCKSCAGLARSHKMVRNLLSSLTFKCVNREQGCKE